MRPKADQQCRSIVAEDSFTRIVDKAWDLACGESGKQASFQHDQKGHHSSMTLACVGTHRETCPRDAEDYCTNLSKTSQFLPQPEPDKSSACGPSLDVVLLCADHNLPVVNALWRLGRILHRQFGDINFNREMIARQEPHTSALEKQQRRLRKGVT